MKKIISNILTIAFLMSISIVPSANAAAVTFTVASGDRQNFTLDLPAGVDLEAADVIDLRITTTANGNPVDLSANNVASATLGAGAAETITQAGNAQGFARITEGGNDEAAGVDLVFALTSALADNAAYTINYRDSDGNFGATVINFGTANQVTVSATVEPILTLAVTNTAIDLGVLSTTAETDSGTDTNVAVTTNANSGFSILASATAFTGASSSNVIPFVARNAQAAGTEGFSLDVATVNAISTGTGTLSAAAGFNGATGSTAVSTTAQTIASSTGTAANGSVDVNYRANISAITEADAYSTTVTYTVTGNF